MSTLNNPLYKVLYDLTEAAKEIIELDRVGFIHRDRLDTESEFKRLSALVKDAERACND